MTAERPRVTVVMPTHNRAGLMPVTLRAVLRQQDVDLQVVIVDDGSSDATPDVLRAIEDPRVRWHRQEQASGVSNARNAGLAMVDTPWVAFTDDDDLWAPTKLARQLESLRLAPEARWSCVGAVVVDASLRILRHEKTPKLAGLTDRVLKNNCIPAGGSGVVVATELARAVGGFDPQFSNLADWDFWIRLALQAPATAVRHPLVAYRVHATGMAHNVHRTEEELAIIGTKYAAERSATGTHDRLGHVVPLPGPPPSPDRRSAGRGARLLPRRAHRTVDPLRRRRAVPGRPRSVGVGRPSWSPAGAPHLGRRRRWVDRRTAGRRGPNSAACAVSAGVAAAGGIEEGPPPGRPAPPRRAPGLNRPAPGGRARRRSGDLPLFRRTLCRLSYSTLACSRADGATRVAHRNGWASGPDGT